MRITCLLVLCFWSINIHAQNTKIPTSTNIIVNLEDSLHHDKKATYTNFGNGLDATLFAFPVQSDTYTFDDRVYSLQCANFFNNFSENDYKPIHYVIAQKDGEEFICFDMNGDLRFEREFYPITKKMDSIELSFYPKNAGKVGNLKIPVTMYRNKDKVTFNAYLLHTAEIEIDGLTHKLSIWPFQIGPLIRLDTVFGMDLSNPVKYYKLKEPFQLNGKRYCFTDYDYLNKTITLKPVSHEKLLFGYKQETYFEDWLAKTNNTIAWDSLGIDRNRPYLIYFGAKWCLWCKSEYPKIKNMFNVLENNNVGLITVTAQHRESDEELVDFVKEIDLPGIPIIESLKNPNSLIQLLNVATYPSYIFIHSDGKILYRSDYNDETLSDFLFRYMKSN